MRKFSRLLFQRVSLVALSILLQLAVFVSTVSWLSEYRWWIRCLMTVMSVATIIFLLYDRTNSSYKISWVILILAFPIKIGRAHV